MLPVCGYGWIQCQVRESIRKPSHDRFELWFWLKTAVLFCLVSVVCTYVLQAIIELVKTKATADCFGQSINNALLIDLLLFFLSFRQNWWPDIHQQEHQCSGCVEISPLRTLPSCCGQGWGQVCVVFGSQFQCLVASELLTLRTTLSRISSYFL